MLCLEKPRVPCNQERSQEKPSTVFVAPLYAQALHAALNERSDETKNDSDAGSCRTVTARIGAQGILDTTWRLKCKSGAVAPLGILKTENGKAT